MEDPEDPFTYCSQIEMVTNQSYIITPYLLATDEDDLKGLASAGTRFPQKEWNRTFPVILEIRVFVLKSPFFFGSPWNRCKMCPAPVHGWALALGPALVHGSAWRMKAGRVVIDCHISQPSKARQQQLFQRYKFRWTFANVNSPLVAIVAKYIVVTFSNLDFWMIYILVVSGTCWWLFFFADPDPEVHSSLFFFVWVLENRLNDQPTKHNSTVCWIKHMIKGISSSNGYFMDFIVFAFIFLDCYFGVYITYTYLSIYK